MQDDYTGAFTAPTYTQTPNDLFERLPDMQLSELKVTLALLRETLGYHRDSCRLGINKLCELTGLSTNAVIDGAQAAERRGTIKRLNAGSKQSAEWQLVFQPERRALSARQDEQPTRAERASLARSARVARALSEPQSPLKESSKEIKKERRAPSVPLVGADVSWLIASGKSLSDVELTDKERERLELAEKVERMFVELEQGLQVNLDRSVANQSIVKRLVLTGQPVSQFLAWLSLDKWRAENKNFYGNLRNLWRDWPQAFAKKEQPSSADDSGSQPSSSFYA